MTQQPPSLPPHVKTDKISRLEEDIDRLHGELARLGAMVGQAPTPHDPEGSGMFRVVTILTNVVGQPPNAATGEPGSGLCSVVAELALAHRQAQAKSHKMAAASAGGVVALVQILAYAIQHFM